MTSPKQLRRFSCALLAFALGALAWAQEPSGSSRTSLTEQPLRRAQGNAQAKPHFALERAVDLPSGDPRRITLPLMKAGAWLEVHVEPAAGTKSSMLRHVQVEILRDDSALLDGRRKRTQSLADLQSVALSTGPWEQPVRYRAPWDGRYVVVLRQTNPSRETIPLEVRTNLYRQQTAKPSVYTLPAGTRTAVAVFSGGLLWTVLLLCGTPIIRAFRSRRTTPEPPWYA